VGISGIQGFCLGLCESGSDCAGVSEVEWDCGGLGFRV